MKKIVITIVILTAFGLSGMAQSGIFTGGTSQIAKHDLRKIGWIIEPEIGLGYYVDYFYSYDQLCLKISGVAGYQFTPHIFLGIGVEPVIGTMKYYHWNGGTYGSDFALSLYADYRWYWFDGRSSPFLELNTGLLASFDGMHKPGWLITPAFGWNIKGFDIKISASYFLYERKEDWCGWYRTSGLGYFLSIGYDFILNKNSKDEEN